VLFFALNTKEIVLVIINRDVIAAVSSPLHLINAVCVTPTGPVNATSSITGLTGAVTE
jgi:hypothetical protein